MFSKWVICIVLCYHYPEVGSKKVKNTLLLHLRTCIRYLYFTFYFYSLHLCTHICLYLSTFSWVKELIQYFHLYQSIYSALLLKYTIWVIFAASAVTEAVLVCLNFVFDCLPDNKNMIVAPVNDCWDSHQRRPPPPSLHRLTCSPRPTTKTTTDFHKTFINKIVHVPTNRKQRKKMKMRGRRSPLSVFEV